MSSQPREYTPKCVLVTGGAGFIASFVVTRLLKEPNAHFRVVVFDKMDYCASIRNLDAVANHPNLIIVKGNILDHKAVLDALRMHEVDTVMHFAAQSHVDNSFGNSMSFSLNNTLGTHMLLEACRLAGTIRRFINVSTDEVYGGVDFEWEERLDEKSRLEPTNPYSAAKAGAEMLVKAYQRSYKLPCIITRGNNVYGPHQFPEKLVPKFCVLATQGKPLPIHGDGQQTRSYLYVEDVAEAFVLILQRGTIGEIYNIGTQVERSVLSVAADVTRLARESMNGPNQDTTTQTVANESSDLVANGSPSDMTRLAPPPVGDGSEAKDVLNVVHCRDRLFNDRRYFICDAKLLAMGWRERTPWDEGLRKTLAWYGTPGRVAAWWPVGVEDALLPHPDVKQETDEPARDMVIDLLSQIVVEEDILFDRKRGVAAVKRGE